jgi:hypothetical protein
LVKNPEERPSASKMLAHDFISKIGRFIFTGGRLLLYVSVMLCFSS